MSAARGKWKSGLQRMHEPVGVSLGSYIYARYHFITIFSVTAIMKIPVLTVIEPTVSFDSGKYPFIIHFNLVAIWENY